MRRFHLAAQGRDGGQEVSLSLAVYLLGTLTTASRAAMWAELKVRGQAALNGMDSQGLEALVLRHFEGLSTGEAIQVMGIRPPAACNHVVRALNRLKGVFQGCPGASRRPGNLQQHPYGGGSLGGIPSRFVEAFRQGKSRRRGVRRLPRGRVPRCAARPGATASAARAGAS
jgi:hypothetical protein